jgi:hypothetical protein
VRANNQCTVRSLHLPSPSAPSFIDTLSSIYTLRKENSSLPPWTTQSAIVALLSAFPLPLPMNGPPLRYGLEEREMSLESTTSAFNAGIDQRDTFLGRRRCIICGSSIRDVLEYCHIVKDSDPEIVGRK